MRRPFPDRLRQVPWGGHRAEPLVVLVLALAGCRAAPDATPVPFEFPDDEETRRLRVLAEIDSILSADYLYAGSTGVDWSSGLADLEALVRQGADDGAFRQGIREMLAVLPEDTVRYATREERLEEALERTASYEGIGAFIAFRADPEPRLVLLSIVEGSPAERAGLRPHEAIYVIDGEHVRAEEGAAAALRVRGLEGTTVVLEVGAPDGTRRTVEVERRRVVALSDIQGRLMTSGDVHLQVPVLADARLVDAIGVAMDVLAEQSTPGGLVLDLRIAATSDDWPLEEMLALFLDGEQGTFVDRQGADELIVDGVDLRGSQTVPLVLLVGPDTSGAPEIFAAALQARGRAATVGLATRGSVFGYGTNVLSDGSQLIYARSTFRTFRGLDLGRNGVRPVYPVQADWDQVTETRDPVLRTALSLFGR